MAGLQHPLKRDIDKAAQLINEVHQLYNLYFQGVEQLPPHKRRQELEEVIGRLRLEVAKKSNAAMTFLLRQTDSRFQMMRSRWDKTMSQIETGAFRIPPKRK